MNKVFEELDKLYKAAEYPTLLDIVRCSLAVITDDVRSFTHEDAEKIAARFNFDNEVDFEEYFEEDFRDEAGDPLAGRSPEKFIVPVEEVREVIRKITNNYILVNTNARTDSGRKNLRLMNEFDLSEADIRELARQLNVGDYSFSAPSIQPQYAGNILTFFITKKDFRLSDGRTFDNLHVYVKVDTTEDGLVTAISFHRGSGSLRHPYENTTN
jgi:hypothetical protein